MLRMIISTGLLISTLYEITGVRLLSPPTMFCIHRLLRDTVGITIWYR